MSSMTTVGAPAEHRSPAGADAMLGAGFADPVFDAQRWFRLLMGAMAGPGTIVEIRPPDETPEPLAPIAAGLLLTLCDDDTPVWLAPRLTESRWSATWLRFHTGAPLVEQCEAAAFVVATGAGDCPALEDLGQGSDEYPDRSATLVLPVARLGEADRSGSTDDPGAPTVRLALEGPGIDGRRNLAVAGVPEDFPARWCRNRARFPRGVDLMLVDPRSFACLPRSTTLAGAERAG